MVVDMMSVPYLTGAEIEYVDTLQQSGFTINNSNAASTCACGDSFHAPRHDRWAGRSPAARPRVILSAQTRARVFGSRGASRGCGDLHVSLKRVHPLGPQPDDFASAQPGVGGRENHRPVVAVDRITNARDLGRRQELHL